MYSVPSLKSTPSIFKLSHRLRILPLIPEGQEVDRGSIRNSLITSYVKILSITDVFAIGGEWGWPDVT